MKQTGCRRSPRPPIVFTFSPIIQLMPLVTLTPEVRSVLERSVITATTVALPEQLDRKLYQNVNRVLEGAGGTWTRKLKVHVFTGDPREALGMVLEKGVFQPAVDKDKEERAYWQAYYTPPAVAKSLVRMTLEKIKTPRPSLLEPSCGEGAIFAEMVKQGAGYIAIVEKNPMAFVKAVEREERRTFLGTLRSYQDDFLTLKPSEIQPSGGFDAVVMNPPFANGNKSGVDVDHIEHALKFLKVSGWLTSVVMGNSNMKALHDRFVKRFNRYEFELMKLPSNTFSESGTNAETAVFGMRKPEEKFELELN
jgi:predicted RNA methylase